MELRVLHYFLAVTREKSISGAAGALHLSQPTLSRQLREMETELGKQLFVRSNRTITLTEEGMLLRKRAEEILSLVSRTKDEISLSDEVVAGDIHIGAGESEGIRFLAKAAKALQEEYPLVHFHNVSADRVTVTEDLDKGLLDFGILFGDIDTSKYECLKVPHTERFGVLMRRDDPLARKESITPEDLRGKPLIVSRQPRGDNSMLRNLEGQQVVATYNLLFNGSIMVEEGMGYAICFDHIINVSGDSPLCFRPLEGQPEIEMHVVWKKYQVFTKAGQKFLEKLREMADD
ncbi:MAG: LysR family transcriptional regulator [Clostridiales bacterium]|nr:LysR family transcriptional regulator [Clostridiales bacterium]